MALRSPRIALALVSLLAAPLAAQTTTFVSVAQIGGPDGYSSWPTVSDDGRFVAFESDASNLVSNDNNSRSDIFVRDMQTGTTVRASIDPAGADSNEGSFHPLISGNGRFVAFESLASNLVAGDTNFGRDVFVRDLVANTTVRASVSSAGVQGLFDSYLGSISADGRFVAFYSGSNNLVAGDTNGQGDVFLRDLQTGQTTRVSVSSSGAQGNSECDGGSVSADGRYVAFFGWASNLVAGDTNGVPDVFVRDQLSGTTTRVNLSGSGAQDNGGVLTDVFLSADGRFVAFTSYGTNLVSGDTNGFPDVFEVELLTGAIRRVDVDSLGGQSNDHANLFGINGDGRFVVMVSLATNLVPNDTNNSSDVFVHDRVSGSTSRASLGQGQVQANDHSYEAGISADGRYVAFSSSAWNLDPNDPTPMQDVFLRDRGVANTTAYCFGDGTQATPCPCGNSGAAGRGCENSAASGGAELAISAFGREPDSAILSASGIVPGALTIFLQGNSQLAGTNFGDGVRCIGGALKRLYVTSAVGTLASAPTPGSLPLGMQSAFLGDPLASGSTRWYQAWYRDSDANFCSAPQGNLWNVSNGVRVDW